ncbi:uncharacterized protein TNCV_957631 [Trichonephila clavipes]|nr:uncharacterized protein TNCV_957631 [Trichonephila clavipes]
MQPPPYYVSLERDCGPVARPPRSPNLNFLDFFFWDHLKSLVYETLVATVEDFILGIFVASIEITRTSDFLEPVRQSFVRRCRPCYDLRGHNLE